MDGRSKPFSGVTCSTNKPVGAGAHTGEEERHPSGQTQEGPPPADEERGPHLVPGRTQPHNGGVTALSKESLKVCVDADGSDRELTSETPTRGRRTLR